jgi:hypothetical protein
VPSLVEIGSQIDGSFCGIINLCYVLEVPKVVHSTTVLLVLVDRALAPNLFDLSLQPISNGSDVKGFSGNI